MQFGTTQGFDETKRKVPGSESQRRGTDDSRRKPFNFSPDRKMKTNVELLGFPKRKEMLLS